MKRTFTKHPSSYVKADSGSQLERKEYGGYFWDKLNIPENRFVIDTHYFYQYAAGVTGATERRAIYTTPDGFRTKTEAKQFMKLIDLKPYHKKGRDQGYGAVGGENFDISIVPAGSVVSGRYNYLNTVYVYSLLAPMGIGASTTTRTFTKYPSSVTAANKSKKRRDAEIYEYLDDLGGYVDYDGRIELLMDDFGLSKNAAENYVWNHSSGLDRLNGYR